MLWKATDRASLWNCPKSESATGNDRDTENEMPIEILSEGGQAFHCEQGSELFLRPAYPLVRRLERAWQKRRRPTG